MGVLAFYNGAADLTLEIYGKASVVRSTHMPHEYGPRAYFLHYPPLPWHALWRGAFRGTGGRGLGPAKAHPTDSGGPVLAFRNDAADPALLEAGCTCIAAGKFDTQQPCSNRSRHSARAQVGPLQACQHTASLALPACTQELLPMGHIPPARWQRWFKTGAAGGGRACGGWVCRHLLATSAQGSFRCASFSVSCRVFCICLTPASGNSSSRPHYGSTNIFCCRFGPAGTRLFDSHAHVANLKTVSPASSV